MTSLKPFPWLFAEAASAAQASSGVSKILREPRMYILDMMQKPKCRVFFRKLDDDMHLWPELDCIRQHVYGPL